MTFLISAVGVVGRMAGDLLTSALSWASSLLFGRVPKSHQIYLILMMAASLLWLVMLISLVIPRVASVLVSTTPHPRFLDTSLLVVLVVGVVLLPLCVGLAGHLVPSDQERPGGAMPLLLEMLRGYLLAPLISLLLIFLAGVGVARKVRSLRHGWSDTHLPIVVKPGAYEQLVADLQSALQRAGVSVTARDAAWVLTLPARVISAVSGDNVRRLHQDRLVELSGRALEIGVYPSDIAISGKARDRTRARAAMVRSLATTSAHMTMSAEAQKVEDQLAALADGDGRRSRAATRSALEKIDERLTELPVPTDEWDTLYRIRLQIERDVLAGTGSGTGAHRPPVRSSS